MELVWFVMPIIKMIIYSTKIITNEIEQLLSSFFA